MLGQDEELPRDKYGTGKKIASLVSKEPKRISGVLGNLQELPHIKSRRIA